LTAIINKYGEGSLVIDNYEPIDDLNDRVRDIIESTVVPPYDTEIEKFDSRSGSHIRISAIGDESPYSFDGRYYIRNGSSVDIADLHTIVSLALSKGLDPLKGMPSDYQELTFNYFIGMLIAYRAYPHDAGGVFKSFGMLDENGKLNYVAYLLSDQNTLPIQVIEFKGKRKGFIQNRMDFGGQCLIGSYNAVLTQMNSYIKESAAYADEDCDELFDIDAFKEAWINACLHNAWWTLIPPSVSVFDDRVEVTSHGGIPFPSIESFFSGECCPVNRTLMDIFTQLGITEQTGYGVPYITETYGMDAFTLTATSVTVSIPFDYKPHFVEVREARERSRSGLDMSKSEILNYLERNPNAKLVDVVEQTGLTLSSVKKAVMRLKSEGLLRNDGTNRNSVWVVL
jgi:predicted HTH transcriptional regulator